jgi:GNAT superfamily N-acetyltransferase
MAHGSYGSANPRNGARYLRRAVLGDESALRELRLQALLEAPDAFGSTYEKELARTTSDWQQWLSPGVTLILEEPAGARGIVAGLQDATDAGVIHLMAMWVHPAIRGSGAADELVGAVLAWAKSEGAKFVRLNVIQRNDRARRFYERNGFRATGREAVRVRDGQIEVQMERAIDHLLRE